MVIRLVVFAVVCVLNKIQCLLLMKDQWGGSKVRSVMGDKLMFWVKAAIAHEADVYMFQRYFCNVNGLENLDNVERVKQVGQVGCCCCDKDGECKQSIQFFFKSGRMCEHPTLRVMQELKWNGLYCGRY